MRQQPDGRVYWLETCAPPAFPSLAGELAVDVAIVGGGIVGACTARMLKDRGLTVALVEARRVGQGVSGKATAKVTSQHGLAYRRLEKKFGEDGARIYAEAQEAGLRTILELSRAHRLDADIEARDAFVYTLEDKHIEDIEREVEVARRLGLPASLTRETGLPFEVKAAMRWERQAQFHPVKFVAGLAATIAGGGSHVFENSRVIEWSPTHVATGQGRVTARHVVLATNLPIGMVGGYYATNFPMAEPVVAAPIERVPPAYYKNVEQPSRSIRTHRSNGRTYAVAAGSHFTPGHAEDERKNFAELEQWLAEFDAGPVEYRWVNEDYVPIDNAPFIGWTTDDPGDAYLVATGFAAWGFTNGAAAGTLLADLVEGVENPWSDLFDASRLKPLAGGKRFAVENLKVAKELVSGHFSGKAKSFDEIAPGQAAIVSLEEGEVAAFRDEDGQVHAVSAVCTHMGCIVGWNCTDRTWDCPCHGSRFGLSGEVLNGPAVTALAPRPQD